MQHSLQLQKPRWRAFHSSSICYIYVYICVHIVHYTIILEVFLFATRKHLCVSRNDIITKKKDYKKRRSTFSIFKLSTGMHIWDVIELYGTCITFRKIFRTLKKLYRFEVRSSYDENCRRTRYGERWERDLIVESTRGLTFGLPTISQIKEVRLSNEHECARVPRFGSLSPARVRCTPRRNCNGTVYTSRWATSNRK